MSKLRKHVENINYLREYILIHK